MKRRLALLLVWVFSLSLFSGCGHEHTWAEASCTDPKTCTECGATEGEALGHTWADATCTAPKTCSVCGDVEGDALGHDWLEASCTEPERCSRCDETKGQALGHSWEDATCTDPKTCSVCGETEGSALGHSVETWATVTPSTCTELGLESGICSVCGDTIEQELELLEHTPGDWEITKMPTETETGTHVKKCTVCGIVLEEEEFSLTEEELKSLYISQCQSIPYDSLARTPGDYEGENVRFSGYVIQVCSEASSSLFGFLHSYSTYRVATSGRYNNVVYVKIDNYGSGTRILEDDYITFYGTFDGIYTYTTVLGASISIPSVTAKYYD